jgi:diguanylate cyclase (GGDEF)-like protein
MGLEIGNFPQERTLTCSPWGFSVFCRCLGAFVGGWGKIIGFLGVSHSGVISRVDELVAATKKGRFHVLILSGIALVLLFFTGIFYLRFTGAASSPQGYLYLEASGTLISFCYAANAVVRFRGTHDRIALILAFGFVLSGIIETVGYFSLNALMQAGHAASASVPMGWMVSRTLLAVTLLAAIGVERYLPTARQPSRETAGAVLVVLLAAYLTSAAFLAAPAATVAHTAKILSRPWDLLPGVLFLAAAICFRQRLESRRRSKNAPSLYDYSLFGVAALNTVCHAAATFSRHLFDGPFFVAELCKTGSYVVILLGALVEQARLFEQVRSMAVSDSLTGLANCRRLSNVLEIELERSHRTRRPFSVVLLDMDGLKAINGQFGHLTGSRALVRLGKILAHHCRSIDTPARYGGDEFALVLPEAGRDVATRVVARMRERLAAEPERPTLSVSAGVAAFPEDGDTPEQLLSAADRALYGRKNRGGGIQNLTRIAACL